MNILVSNDDGIDFVGIRCLAEAMEKLGKVTVVAPKDHQSGAGHSITFGKCVNIQKVKFSDTIDGYAVEGRPADCVSFALNGLVETKFDLVVTGINEGENIANCAIASGTCGSACAGLLYGVPSIAVSLAFGNNYNYKKAASYAVEVAEWFVKQPFNKQFALSVNIPNIDINHIKGYQVCGYGVTYLFHKNISFTTRGNQITVDTTSCTNNVSTFKPGLCYDYDAIKNNYIALTPLGIDITDYSKMDLLKTFSNEK